MDTESLTYLTATRRKLHALAELSGKEYNTSAFIVEELKSMGYKPKTVGTGVIVDIGKGGGRLALRADIDALPIAENTSVTGCDFAASGAMHACGHDGHTANLLNIARILGGKAPTPVRLIFQYGEEGLGGSVEMIENGALDEVTEIYALHLCPELDEGKIGYCYGCMFAGAVEFDCIMRGKSAHCASPESGADAIGASVFAANAAYAAARENGLLLNLGRITGGSARNIIADKCVSEYTLRYFDSAKSEAAMMQIERALIAADEKYGTYHELAMQAVYPPLVNNALAVDKVRSLMGERAVPVASRLTAEDFSNYLNVVPGCMVWLGIKTREHCSPLHSDTFSFDESVLLVGTELFMKLIRSHDVSHKKL